MEQQIQDGGSSDTIRILASIQTTNGFILEGMKELKSEITKVGENVQQHSLAMQSYGAELSATKRDAQDAARTAADLKNRMYVVETKIDGMPEPKSHWSIENVKVIGILGSVFYVIVEILKAVVLSIIHPGGSGPVPPVK